MRARLRHLLFHCRNTGELVLAALREIFDEAAYERFLLEHRLSAGAEAYAAFCRDHADRKLRRPRCC